MIYSNNAYLTRPPREEYQMSLLNSPRSLNSEPLLSYESQFA